MMQAELFELTQILKLIAKDTDFVFAADSLNEAADTIERLAKENEANRWISVRERLPDDDDTVEAYNPGFGAFDAYCTLNGRNKREWLTRGHEINVTHWRRPQPPQK